MQSKRTLFVRWKLHFSRTKVVVKNGEKEYFIRPFSLDRGYLEGDIIEIKVVRGESEWYLAEGIIKKIIARTNLPIIGTIRNIKGGKIQVEVFREFGNIGNISVVSNDSYAVDDIIEVRYEQEKKWQIQSILGKSGDPKTEEMLLFRKEWIRTDFSEKVLEEAEKMIKGKIERSKEKTLIPKYITDNLEKAFFNVTAEEFFPTVLCDKNLRTDFRNWFTMTIDGADAKDLDDAISIARYTNGNFLLAVHIADVAEYVREWSELDREAILRTTSIYTPGRVIPMLPEKLSNDLCSLHPGEPKLVLSILMKVDQKWEVLATFMTEGIIESQKRGIYEEIIEEKQKEIVPDGNVSEKLDSETSSEWQKLWNTGLLHSPQWQKNQEWQTKIPHLSDFFSLFHILEKRRKKEGKIIFESSEPTFTFDANDNITNIEKRERGPSHMMIEEFMVLANEEVAKWCTKHSLPFLSRIHHLPPEDNAKIIREIVGLGKSHEPIHPKHIREYLDTLSTDEGMYRASRLLLPKMAKAFYSDKSLMHFGLALEYYAHFTSPIRRYPDLQVHRIIKEELQKTLDKKQKEHYRHILKKIAKKCSDGEARATDIERAVDAIMVCRYMSDKVGETFDGRVNGFTDWAIFVELDNGVEVTVYLGKWREKWRYIVDSIRGTLSLGQKILHTIGEPIRVKIIGVNTEDRRVEWEIL